MLVVIIDRARILKTRKIEACLQFAASIVIANRTFVHFSSLHRSLQRISLKRTFDFDRVITKSCSCRSKQDMRERERERERERGHWRERGAWKIYLK